MKKVLIVEDKKIMREIVSQYFAHEGYEVLSAVDGQTALDLFKEHEVDLVILDIMLPKIDGWSVCRRIRKLSNVPIIFLSARSDEEDTLLGFELGADDYVTKPFKPAILLARANRLLKKPEQKIEKVDVISYGDININKLARVVSIEGKKINLTPIEYEILLYLMEHKGQVLTRESIIKHIWGNIYTGEDSSLNAHMRNVRKKLGSKATSITTVIRVGYKFEVES